jgi:hypothetical protein
MGVAGFSIFLAPFDFKSDQINQDVMVYRK